MDYLDGLHGSLVGRREAIAILHGRATWSYEWVATLERIATRYWHFGDGSDSHGKSRQRQVSRVHCVSALDRKILQEDV